MNWLERALGPPPEREDYGSRFWRVYNFIILRPWLSRAVGLFLGLAALAWLAYAGLSEAGLAP